jgi:virginiamycin B lyase
VLTLALAAAIAMSGQITEYKVPTHVQPASPAQLVSGPGNQMWTAVTSGWIAAIAMNGEVTERRIPVAGTAPVGIAADGDGAVWFSESRKPALGRMTVAGRFTQVPARSPGLRAFALTTAADGSVWFADDAGNGGVGRVIADRHLLEYRLSRGTLPQELAAAPDGSVWFAAWHSGEIGRVTPHGRVRLYRIPTPQSEPVGVAVAADGSVWFAEAHKLGRVTPAGSFSEFRLPRGSEADWLAAGPDGDVWFTETNDHRVGRITPAGQMTVFRVPGPQASPFTIAAGPDGNMWFTTRSGVARITTGASPASARPPSITGTPTVGSTLICGGEQWNRWSATGPATVDVEWQRNGLPIPGATGRAHVVTSADAGHSLSCTATARYVVPAAMASARSAAVTVGQ